MPVKVCLMRNDPISANAVTLTVDGVSKAFGDRVALDDVSFEGRSGEVIVLLGANGCGKTTLLSGIVGVLPMDHGCIGLDDELVQPLPRRTPGQRLRIGFSAQKAALYPGLSVKENLAHFARLRVGWAQAGREVDRVVDFMHLGDWLNRRCCSLSGGQARRVHVAAGFLGDPPLVVLDEPTAGMDLEARELVVTAIRDMVREGTLIVMATHDVSDLEPLGPRVIVMKDGRVLWDGFGVHDEGDERLVLKFKHSEPRSAMPMGGCFEVGEEWIVTCPLEGRSMRDVLAQLSDEDSRNLVSSQVESSSLLAFYRRLTVGEGGGDASVRHGNIVG